MQIYFADLGHNQLTVSSDVFPLGIANLATYLHSYAGLREPLHIRLFREPLDLKAALDSEPPEVLGLSNYAWNHELARHFAGYAKARSPLTLTVLGGPNFPLEVAQQKKFLQSIPEVDVVALGPTYEGERAVLNIVERFAQVGHSLEGLQEEPIPGAGWIDRRTGEYTRGAPVARIADLDEIPSPYLGGFMDGFFSTGYFPMVQIARGCPFSCSYCNSSVEANSKIRRHSVENVKADLLYIAQHVRPEITLCFADDNFGMYEADEEVAEYVGWLQDRFGWPRYIRTTTGKNRHDRIIRTMRKLRGILPFTAAVQSLNPVVLTNIRRSNIKLESYTKIQEELRSQGMQSYGELIICLPGETRESFMKAVSDLLDTGIKRVSAHQLMLLHGAPLSNSAERQRHQFKTRFRVVARNIGNYTGVPVVETEEIVVETPTFSFEDYLDTRVFHLLLTIFYYEGNFEEAFEFARQEGIKPFDLIVHLQAMLDQAPAALKQMIDGFWRESLEELFSSREECIDWARRNFDGLVDGTLGGNLLSKYSLLARFYTTSDTLSFLEAAILSALGPLRAEREELLRTVMEYLRVVQLSAPFAQSLDRSPVWVTRYDVEAWRRGGYLQRLGDCCFPESRSFAAVVEPNQRTLIQSRIATFGEHPSQLGKFTRTMFARDLRRTLLSDGPTGEASVGGLV